MGADPPEPNPLPVGLLCAGALVFGRHALLVDAAPDPALAPWLLARSLPERLVEALVLGVVASALAHRARGALPLGFNALVLTWGAAGLPRPDVGAAWPLALLLGLALAGAVAWGGRVRPRLLCGRGGTALAGALGIGLPLLLLGRVPAPLWPVERPVATWPAPTPHTDLELDAPPTGGPFLLRWAGADVQVRVDGELQPPADATRAGRTVPVPAGASVRLSSDVGFEGVALLAREQRSPAIARPDAPCLVLVLLDGAGFARADASDAPSLAALARGGTRFTRAVAAAGTRAAALASILSGDPCAPPDPEPGTTLAEVLAERGFATALFGAPRLARPSRHAAGFQVARLDAASAEVAVARAAGWLRGVAGLRFLLVVHLPTDVPSDRDLQRAGGRAAAAGLAAADLALGSLRAHLEHLALDVHTVIAVVGTVELEGTEDGSMRQQRLHVPLVLAGPGLPLGRVVQDAVEARAVAATLAARAGVAARPGLDLTAALADRARFLGLDGARGVRQGDWTLWLDAAGGARLHQVASDPNEAADLAPARPEREGALRALLGG